MGEEGGGIRRAERDGDGGRPLVALDGSLEGGGSDAAGSEGEEIAGLRVRGDQDPEGEVPEAGEGVVPPGEVEGIEVGTKDQWKGIQNWTPLEVEWTVQGRSLGAVRREAHHEPLPLGSPAVKERALRVLGKRW